MAAMIMPQSIEFVEVGPRDGLQNEAVLVSTADKLSLLDRAIAAGARRIEVTSFVNPKRVPQMADAEQVCAGLPDRSDVSFIGLVMNVRGTERALVTGRIDQLARMRGHNAQLKQAIDASRPDVPKFLDHNRLFHAVILEAAASERLASMLLQVTEQPVVLRTARQYDLENLRRSHHEHDELLIAFDNRDGDWAAAVMTAHIRRAFHAYAEAHSTDTEIGKSNMAA